MTPTPQTPQTLVQSHAALRPLSTRRNRTWRILEWKDEPAVKGEPIPLDCECGAEADLPCGLLIGASLIAIIHGNGMIFDPAGHVPPDNWLPTVIQCRKCGCKLTTKTEEY